MKQEISDQIGSAVINYLRACKCPNTGAFCGGPYQLPHILPTYSAVCALMIINTDQALSLIDRQGIKNFFISMKDPEMPGNFRVHQYGESDMRAVYCVVCVSFLLGVLNQEIMENVAQFVRSCQTYEGGLGCQPGGEAHGGYTYCGLAALYLMEKTCMINRQRMLEWCANRQMSVEGGFNGRTNKLVDSCYNFWVGACFPMLKDALGIDRKIGLYDKKALQAYTLVCCQATMGLYDRPGSRPDYYHTSNSIAGLSLSQDNNEYVFRLPSVLQPNDPCFNVTVGKVERAKAYFRGKINQ